MWDETFDTAGLDANLNFRNAFGTMTQDGAGTLELDVNSGSKFYRSMIYADTDDAGLDNFNGNSVFNFNTHTVSTQFDFNSNNMADTAGIFVVDMGVLSIENNEAKIYTGFRVELDFSGGVNWEISFVEYFEGGAPVSTTFTRLDAKPTAFGFDVSGQDVTLSVTGANFTIGGTGTTADVWSIPTAYTYASYGMAFGARENDSAAPGVHVELDSFQVDVVPEPGTYALLAGGLALASVMVRRCR